jgi:hypothetical protein
MGKNLHQRINLIFSLSIMLYGVGETDALTFALVTTLVLGVAILATAWRATRIDPITSLRAE